MKSPLSCRFCLVLLLLAGCASKEAMPRYYVLTPAGSAATGSPHGTRIFIRGVSVPGYLSANKLVSRRGDSQVEYAPGAMWAEGLSEGIKGGLAAALSRQRGVGAVIAAPYAMPPTRDYDLKIDVERFEGEDSGQVVAVIRWTLYRPESAEVVATKVSRQTRTGWKYGDYPAMAEMLSQDLAAVGDDIARSIRR